MSQLALEAARRGVVKRVLRDDALWGKILRYALSAEFLDVRPRFLHKAQLQLVHKQLEWLIASSAPNWNDCYINPDHQTKGWFPNWVALGFKTQLAFQSHTRNIMRWEFDPGDSEDDDEEPIRWNQDGDNMFEHLHQTGKQAHWYGSRSHVWQVKKWDDESLYGYHKRQPTRSNNYLKQTYGKEPPLEEVVEEMLFDGAI